jgi:hypothetical protein
MRVVTHEIVLGPLHEHLATQERRTRSYELTDFRVDDAGNRVVIDMQHYKSLLVQSPVIHSSKELDHHSGA